MFGQDIKKQSPHKTPSWITDIQRSAHAKANAGHKAWVSIPATAWFPSTRHAYGCASCWGYPHAIELHTLPEKTDNGVMVVLHETAHILDGCKKSRNVHNKASGYHGISFWQTLAPLYVEFGVYDYAIAHEGYLCGRRWLKEHRAEYILPLKEVAA